MFKVCVIDDDSKNLANVIESKLDCEVSTSTLKKVECHVNTNYFIRFHVIITQMR